MQRPSCSQAQQRACTTLPNTHFFCEATTFITASMTEEETSCSVSRTKEICSCFSPLHLLPHYSSSASSISCRIHNKPPYHMTAFASPTSFSYLQLPSAISKLPSKCTPCPLVLSSLPLLGWPAKHRAQRPAVLQPRLERAKSWNCSGFSSSEGHQQ